MSCRVCENPQCKDIINEIASGNISLNDAAKKLNVTYNELVLHIKEHLNALPKPEIGNDEIDIGKALREMLRLLKARVFVFLDTEVTPDNERMLTSLVKETRGLVMNIAELEGKLSNQPIIELKTVKMQFNDLTGFLITELCLVCRAKIQQKLEQMINE